MAYQYSLAKWFYDSYLKPPDPQIPMFERFTTDDGPPLYRELSTNEMMNEAGVLEKLAHLERKPLTEVEKISDRFIVDVATPPPEPEKIPLFERFTTDDGKTLFRSLDSSQKEVTQSEAVRQIARDERTSLSVAWSRKDNFIVDEVKPEPEPPHQQQQNLPKPIERKLLPEPPQHTAYRDSEGGIGHSGRLGGGSTVIRSWDVEPQQQQQKHTLELDR